MRAPKPGGRRVALAGSVYRGAGHVQVLNAAVGLHDPVLIFARCYSLPGNRERAPGSLPGKQ
jgi:hypothetical protein